MSAIASFTLIPRSALNGLRDAAIVKRRWLGKPKDTYWDFLERHGREVAQFEWSGYVIATLLPFLHEHQIHLMHSELDDLSTDLTQKRDVATIVFTEAHKRAYLSKLTPDAFSEEQLRDYYNEFNETSEPDVGQQMLDGVRAIEQSLRALDENTVVLVTIG